MAKDLDYYKKLAERMIADDSDRDKAFDAYDNMYHCDWELHKDLKGIEWIRKVTSTDPHDAVAAGGRVLSSLEPQVKLQALANNTPTKKLANEWETNLKWQLKSANRRRQAGVVQDFVRSALLYDEIAAQVIDLDYQIEQMEDELFKGDTARLRNARRYGRFLVQTYHPKSVHVYYSGLMPEVVLLCQRRPCRSVISEWGNFAKDLEEHEEDYCNYYDLMDYKTHAVWVEPEEGGGEIEIIKPSEHKLPFMNWVTMVGATSLEADPKHARQPILYAVYMSGGWETQNVVKTLYTSEVIAHASAPRGKEEGTNIMETTMIDYGDPTRIAKVPQGNVYTPLPPPPIDQALVEIDRILAMGIDKSTVSRILMNADIPSGTAFETINLATQTAVGSLKPAKQLAEKGLAEMFTQMLLWVQFTKKPLLGYGADRRNGFGSQYVIEPEMIDPEAIYIDVELTPDIPTYKQQRVNTAMMAVQALNYPREYALEDIGVSDPQAAEKQRYLEMLADANLQLVIQGMQAQQQLMIAQQQQAMAMEQQAAMMEEQQAQQMQQGAAGAPPESGAMGPPGGQGFNPAAGGQPPAAAFPGGTFEGMTGTTRGGQPVEEGF